MADRDLTNLREQLRALGYLDARVDRFVLGGAGTRQSAITLAAGASVRIGLLAAVLLGPAAAIGTATRVPGLITRLSDAAVLAAYLGVCFGLAIALASFAAILPAESIARRGAAHANFARRARLAARTAGVTVGVACLAYLTMWWRVASAASGATSFAGAAAVLLVAVAISLVLGHVVMITALACVARADATLALSRRSSGASWKFVAPLGVIAFAGAGALLFATTPTPPPAPPALAVVPTGQRLIVIAIDGVDPDTLTGHMAAGRGGTDGAFRTLASVHASLTSDPNRDPARVWTTIATGQPPERHGIGALEVTQVAGMEGRAGPASGVAATVKAATDLLRLTKPGIASGNERRIPTFWEVAARAGLRTAVVHWWATWPADADSGIVISDRAVLRLEHGGTPDAEIAPAPLYAELRATGEARRARVATMTADVVPAGTTPNVSAVIARSAALDATLIDVASDPALGALDLLSVYLPGLDIAQHELLTSDAGATVSPSAMAERVAAIGAYYAFLDRALAPLASRALAPGTIVMLVTQPGRVAQPGRGVLAMAGAAAGAMPSRPASPECIAPLVLYALGVPVASDLPDEGDVTSLLPQAFGAAHPIRMVSTYGSRHVSNVRGAGQPLDREMIERMRSLGYLK